MKPITATLLAAALSAAFATASAADAKVDSAAYRNMTAKATADYTAASANCKGMGKTEHKICHEEAKVARARAELDAVTQYNDTKPLRTKARTALANAEYSLAKLTCAAQTGAEKDSCLNNAKSVHTAAVADAKADRAIRVATNVDSTGAITNTQPSDPAKAAAVEKCAQVAGQPSTGCLIDNKGTATAAAATAGAVANRTENLAERAVDKTKEVARNVANKTERAAENLAVKTERATETAAVKTERTAENMEAKTERAAVKTGNVVADSVITTKVKADIFKEPELKSMGIHVETEKGVVMLSGFVDSKADAEKAVRLAKQVEGVSSVKSAIKVK